MYRTKFSRDSNPLPRKGRVGAGLGDVEPLHRRRRRRVVARQRRTVLRRLPRAETQSLEASVEVQADPEPRQA